jgi:PAS domain-containing protein
MTLKTRTRLSFLFLLTLTLPGVVLAWFYLNQGEQIVERITQAEQLMRQEIRVERLAEKTAIEVLTAETAVLFHLSLKTPESLSRALESLDKIQRYASEGQGLSQCTAPDFEQIQRSLNEYRKTLNALNQKLAFDDSSIGVTIEEQVVFEKTLERLRRQMQQTANQIFESSGARIQGHIQQIEQYAQQRHQQGQRFKRNVIATVLISLIIGIGVVRRFTQRLVQPLHRITQLVHQINAGEQGPAGMSAAYSATRALAPSDEIGQLAEAIDQFLVKFHTYDRLKTQRIHEQVNVLETVCNLSGIGVLILDLDGQILFFSQRILHLTDSASKVRFGEAIDTVLIDASLAQFLKEVLRTRIPVNVTDFWVERKDGGRIPMEIHIGFLEAEDASRAPTSALVILRDPQYGQPIAD